MTKKPEDITTISVRKDDVKEFKELFEFLARKNEVPAEVQEQLTFGQYFSYLVKFGREAQAKETTSNAAPQ